MPQTKDEIVGKPNIPKPSVSEAVLDRNSIIPAKNEGCSTIPLTNNPKKPNIPTQTEKMPIQPLKNTAERG
jgi:hypothetical protein